MIKEKLSNLYDIGSSKRVFQSEWREKGVPFFRAREIARLSEDGYVDNELFIDEDLYEEYTEKYGKPQPGDVMVTGVGTLGVCYVVKPEDKFYFKDGNILWFKQKAPERILPEYLVKAFDSKEVKDFIAKNSSGTTVGTFTIQTANKMEISLPSLDQQKKIIERISKLEEIIKKRQLEIEKLDELIKARFVEMFGDPVHNTYGLPEATLPELGIFGRGVSKHRPRNDPKLLNGPYPLIQTGDVANSELYITSYSSTYSELGLQQSKMWDKGTLCITIAANIAQTAILTFDACFPDSVVGFMANDKTSNIFIHYWFSFFQEILESQAPMSAQKNINLKVLSELKVITPDRTLQDEFEQFVKQVDKSKSAVQKALEETQLLFDSLMQKYFG